MLKSSGFRPGFRVRLRGLGIHAVNEESGTRAEPSAVGCATRMRPVSSVALTEIRWQLPLTPHEFCEEGNRKIEITVIRAVDHPLTNDAGPCRPER